MKLSTHETFHNKGNNDDGDDDDDGHDDEDHDNDSDDNSHGNDDHKMNFIKSTSSKAITRFTSSNS